MSASASFRLVKRQVCEIIAKVPNGELTTTAAIGEAIDVPERHVAFIISRLDIMDRVFLPWHRAIRADGTIVDGDEANGQAERLASEGHEFNENGALRDFDRKLVEIGADWFTIPERATDDAREDNASAA